ncbi:hypothetical protein C5167_004641 [Papaver somniferum]|uniref:Uncharacterized protein n=1 Tax=Papaver somniferum TaxID=3469 RepID=A0A4Y7J938_PAPSO|nr:hypothetical protein C5167_004641 [Papaver somniferum]
MDADATSELHKRGVSPSDDSVVKAIYNGAVYMNNTDVADAVGIIMETTSFYAEQGGQILGSGSISCLWVISGDKMTCKPPWYPPHA